MAAPTYDYGTLMAHTLGFLGSAEPTLVELADELDVPRHIANKVIHELRQLAGKENAAIIAVKDGWQGQTRYRLTVDPHEVAGWRLTQTRGVHTRVTTIRAQLRVETQGTNGRSGWGRSVRRAERILASVEDELVAGVEELEDELTRVAAEQE